MKTLLAAAVVVALAGFCGASQASAADQPETVMITLHCKPGSEAALAEVIARHYDTARKLNMLHEGAPHVTLRSTDADAKASFVEILTWRDAAAPDSAPPAILILWQEMNKLVEPRGGRAGLSIDEVALITR